MIINIENLQLKTIIGILPHERKIPQIIIINGTFSYTYKDQYINYATIKETIIEHLQNSKFGLLEDALLGLHNKIKDKFPELEEVDFTIKKPNIFDDAIVGVSLKIRY
ncbi:MAG: FolB domain-containing protein [Wolinella sp.]